MKHSSPNLESIIWAKNNFENTLLFNKKKTARLIQISSRLAQNKGTSIARLFDNWYDIKAAYKLLNEPIMTPDTIQCQHRQLTLKSMENWEGDVLAIEDSSEFEWNGKEPIEGLGPIGSGREKDQGFILHSTLCLGIQNQPGKDYNLKVLGLPYQQYYVRPSKRENPAKRRFGDEDLETNLWRKVVKHKAIPAKKNTIRVCDRAADLYEVLIENQEYGCSSIIRLRHDRKIIDTKDHIKAYLSELPVMGKTILEKRVKNSNKIESIPLDLSWQEVELQPPYRPGKKLKSIKMTAVRVWGVIPEREELIEWFLYTDLAVNKPEDAIKISKYYACRWIIEDYHKALKSSLRAEQLQFETAHAIFSTISIMSIVALRLLDLREQFRRNPESPAEESGLSKIELEVLGTYLKRELKTVRCVALAIGRLGGHQNRRSDGMPGFQSLWWGLSRFLTMMEGYYLA